MSKPSASDSAESPKDRKKETEGKKEHKSPETSDTEIKIQINQEVEAEATPESTEESPLDKMSDETGTPEDALEEIVDTEKTDEEGESAEEEVETPEEREQRYQAEIDELNDKYLRLVAEFENFKRRTNQEIQSRFKYASQPLALSIIAGLDSLERALEQAEQAVEENDIEQFKEFVAGLEMVKQQFYDAFKNNDIERSFPKGEAFDPNVHEAMSVVESDEVEPDHVVEVFQAGYTLHDRTIRPAMVQVAKKK